MDSNQCDGRIWQPLAASLNTIKASHVSHVSIPVWDLFGISRGNAGPPERKER